MILSHCLQVPKNKNPGENKMYIENHMQRLELH